MGCSAAGSSQQVIQTPCVCGPFVRIKYSLLPKKKGETGPERNGLV